MLPAQFELQLWTLLRELSVQGATLSFGVTPIG
jgi:hypothetical protein